MSEHRISASSGIVELSATQLSAAIHRKEVSCTEVLQAFWGQIDRLNPVVNALVAPVDRDALRAADTIEGPAIVEEAFATHWITRGWTARLGAAGTLIAQRDTP